MISCTRMEVIVNHYIFSVIYLRKRAITATKDIELHVIPFPGNEHQRALTYLLRKISILHLLVDE